MWMRFWCIFYLCMLCSVQSATNALVLAFTFFVIIYELRISFMYMDVWCCDGMNMPRHKSQDPLHLHWLWFAKWKFCCQILTDIVSDWIWRCESVVPRPGWYAFDVWIFRICFVGVYLYQVIPHLPFRRRIVAANSNFTLIDMNMMEV